MKKDDLNFYLICRFYIYKSFYILFLGPIDSSSVKILGDDYIVGSCSDSDDKFKMERYGNFKRFAKRIYEAFYRTKQAYRSALAKRVRY